VKVGGGTSGRRTRKKKSPPYGNARIPGGRSSQASLCRRWRRQHNAVCPPGSAVAERSSQMTSKPYLPSMKSERTGIFPRISNIRN